MIQERELDIEALNARRQEYLLQRISDKCAAEKNAAARQWRLEHNKYTVEVLACDERVARDELDVAQADAWEVLMNRFSRLSDDIARGVVDKQRQQARCDATYDRRERRVQAQDDAIDAADAAAGREAMRTQREECRRMALQREANAALRAKRQEEMGAARVYMIGEEARMRVSIEAERTADLADLRREQRAATTVAKAAEHDRWMNSDEQKQLAAEREKKAAEERATMARKEAEFKRDQARMMKNCTHSRAGTSVFSGTFAKKMCLICKVKFDDVQGIYVRMS